MKTFTTRTEAYADIKKMIGDQPTFMGYRKGYATYAGTLNGERIELAIKYIGVIDGIDQWIISTHI